MRIVVALGGNALLRRGQPLTADNQRANVQLACEALAPLTRANELVVSHGNGPQVGLLALQGAAYHPVPTYPLDVLGAETQGMIGYLIELELGNCLPTEVPLATLLTMIEVDGDDPAFADPTKPIGPTYDRPTADQLAQERGWVFKPDGDAYRRVVASPEPRRILELRQIEWLLQRGCVVICAGGGGIPTAYESVGHMVGVEAVIDKDRASALLATGIGADALVLASDVDAVYLDWDSPTTRAIARIHPDELMKHHAELPAGSMGPKVEAACRFAATGGTAAIGALADVAAMIDQRAGTIVSVEAAGMELHPRADATTKSKPRYP
jgi:carbamate kinase